MNIPQIKYKIDALESEKRATAKGFEVGTRELAVAQLETAIASQEIALQLAEIARKLRYAVIAPKALPAWFNFLARLLNVRLASEAEPASDRPKTSR